MNVTLIDVTQNLIEGSGLERVTVDEVCMLMFVY